MSLILTADQSRILDRAAVKMGVPGLVLMENASRGAAERVDRIAGDCEVVVVCGPGNNGGDGLGVARHLCRSGRSVLALIPEGDLSPDATAQRDWCEAAGVPIRHLAQGGLSGEFSHRPWVVDAMFGTGLSRPLEPPWSLWADELTSLRTTGKVSGVVSVDLPSGLDADRAMPIGPHVTADLTVTFAAEKPACVLSPNAEACGVVEVVDLGFDPRTLIEDLSTTRLEQQQVASMLEPLPMAAHKGICGHLLVVGGSRGMSGAPALASLSALRAGVGLVTLAAPEGVVQVSCAHVPEALSLPLAAGVQLSLTIDAAQEVVDRCANYDAIALGPGLGAEPVAREVARQIAMAVEVPLVLDADGLNAFAGALESLRSRRAETVLTPHVGELSRLLEVEREEIAADPLNAARTASDASGQVVLLKGATTVVASPGGSIVLVREGTPGMATGGTGDVLTGVVGALLAGGLSAVEAAAAGAWVHARAGRMAAEARSERGMISRDVMDELSRVWRQFEPTR